MQTQGRLPLRRVLVVLPARDAASTLDAQLAALSAQDCPLPHVVVVVDDQSRDATAEIARSWAEGDRRIQLETAQSGGHASSRNFGTAGALAGDLVAFCDADDVVAEGWLADADVVGGALSLSCSTRRACVDGGT